MDSDLPDYAEAAEQLANLSSSGIPFLCNERQDVDQGNMFDSLFQNSSSSSLNHQAPPSSSIFDLDPSLGALQHALVANSNAPPVRAQAGFLQSPSLPAIQPEVQAASKQRSRSCSFFFLSLKPEKAPEFILKMVEKLCIIQQSGSTNGVKLERNPTFFVDSFTAHKEPVEGVWVLLTSSSTDGSKWARVAKTVGADSYRVIPQNNETGKLTHGYRFISKQFGLADDDDQIFTNVVKCPELPSV